MSSMSLEERRAERRRRRQQEDTTSVATVNGEDDLERKRRERREQRLRASGDTDYSASTDDYSSRSSRRRGTEDEISEDTSSYSSYRSRRQRNWDAEEDTPKVIEKPVANSVPDTSEEDLAAERHRRQREEEEEEARRQAEREAEEERQRQAELEEERKREEQRRREEARRREEEERQEEERRQAEEEERRRKEADGGDSDSESFRSSEEDIRNRNTAENKLFIEEDDIVIEGGYPDRFERVRKWNEDSYNVERKKGDPTGRKWNRSEQTKNSTKLDKPSNIQEINNNKIKDKLDKFEHLKEESESKVVKDKTVFIPVVEKDGLKEKLQKFEQEIKEQELAKDGSRTQGHHLKQEKADISDVPKRNVLDRWKYADRQSQEASLVKSAETKEHIGKRLSGNTEYIAARFLEKASNSVEEPPPTPKTPLSTPTHRTSFTLSLDHRRTSQSSETHSDVSEDLHSYQRSKVASRWPYEEIQSGEAEIGASNQSKVESTPNHSRSQVTSQWSHSKEHVSESKGDNEQPYRFNGEPVSDRALSPSQSSRVDARSETSTRGSQLGQEEEEEEERLRQEKAGRMAAEEGQKKRGKRKGLGGLTPEKKKKLKDFIADIVYDDDELAEKEAELAIRVQPLPDDLDFLSSAELRKLIKELHGRLAQIHSDAYDTEFKLNKQEKEIVDLNMKISDSKGKFAKPVLRKVNKTEQKFAKMSKKAEHKEDFRETLKSAHDDDDEDAE